MIPNRAYGALTFGASASLSSAPCLQWSADGQVFFVTKYAVYILTPDLTPIIGSQSKLGRPGDEPLRWRKTSIELDRNELRCWPDFSKHEPMNDFGVLTVGSLDSGFRAVACSPSNLAENGGCAVAILTTNMDLSLWAASPDGFMTKWVKLSDIIPISTEQSSQAGVQSPTAQTLQAQTTCVTWSPQADFGISPSPCLDGSLLVAGTRAGALNFLRFDGRSNSRHVCAVDVGEWTTHIAFSPWIVVGERKCEAQVAYGTSDGSVGVVKVTQWLEPLPELLDSVPSFTVKIQSKKSVQPIALSDKKRLSALKWIVAKDICILVYCKPGFVHMWSHGSVSSWTGCRSLELQTQKTSSGASCLNPVSGLNYLPEEDFLIVSLTDGSIHAIQNLTSEPSWSLSASGNELCNERISGIARSIFNKTELGKITQADVNRINGLISYDGHSDILWIHESCQPMDCSYKYDTRHFSTLVTTRLYDRSLYTFLNKLSVALSTAKATSGCAPIHILRPFLLYVLDHDVCHEAVVELLTVQSQTVMPASAVKFPHYNSLGPTPRFTFRSSLRTHLFGFDTLLQLRLSLYLAEFLWEVSSDSETRDASGRAASCISQTISRVVLGSLARHLSAVSEVLIDDDMSFIIRIAHQASLFSRSPHQGDLEIPEIVKIRQVATLFLNSRHRSEQSEMEEPCPACDARIAFSGENLGCCPNGHSWSRCSITSFLMSTPMMRTCSGCSRKAFLPLSVRKSSQAPNWLPTQARSWVVEELLEAVNHCLYCGNNF